MNKTNNQRPKLKKLDDSHNYSLSVDLNLCDSVYKLINNIHVEDVEKNKLYEVVINPLGFILNKYDCLTGLKEYGMDDFVLFESVTKFELMDLNAKLNSLSLRVHYNGERVTNADKKIIDRAYRVAQILFYNYEGGK